MMKEQITKKAFKNEAFKKELLSEEIQANTVCIFLRYVIEKEFDEYRFTKIVLFSNAAGRSNRNYTVFAFLLTLCIDLNIEIWRIFPVGSHSYCQCDRIFGIYSQKKKKLEQIETAAKYIKLIKGSLTPPFIMIESANNILHDFEKSFKGSLRTSKARRISQACVIKYLPKGNVQHFYHYYGKNPSQFTIKPSIKIRDMEKIAPPKFCLKKAKMKDVKSLLKYISPKGQKFFSDYFALITKIEEVDDSVISDEE